MFQTAYYHTKQLSYVVHLVYTVDLKSQEVIISHSFLEQFYLLGICQAQALNYKCVCVSGTANGPLLVLGQGLGADGAVEAQKIYQENQARLQGMSQSDIMEEQKLLLAQLGEIDFPLFLSLLT